MKKIVKITTVMIIMGLSFLGFSFKNTETNIGNDKNVYANCSANCLFSSCKSNCGNNTTAVCLCRFGFARCQCGTTVGVETETARSVEVSSDPAQIAVANKFIDLLKSFQTNEGNKAANLTRAVLLQSEKNNTVSFYSVIYKYDAALQELSADEKKLVNDFFDENKECGDSRLK